MRDRRRRRTRMRTLPTPTTTSRLTCDVLFHCRIKYRRAPARRGSVFADGLSFRILKRFVLMQELENMKCILYRMLSPQHLRPKTIMASVRRLKRNRISLILRRRSASAWRTVNRHTQHLPHVCHVRRRRQQQDLPAVSLLAFDNEVV